MPCQSRITLGASAIIAAAAVTFLAAKYSASQATATDDHPTPQIAKNAKIEPATSGSAKKRQIRYDRDIRPILSDRCFKCHGPDPAARQAGLRLDHAQPAADKDDEPAVIVPGAPDESELFSRISSNDAEDRMPPPGSNKRTLSVDERELVRLWIEQGANYEPHWSFVPPLRSTIPAPSNSTWGKNEIDSFVLDQLESEGIEPAPPVDRATLIRRLFLDLTGLPPTPQEVAAFVDDLDERAYDQWIDRLLTEEPYRSRHAEHFSARWLDAARYADTIGIHTDAGRQMWPWRDWVLNAFRNNMPFDQFVVEQLAGDLVSGATLDQKVASGFNRNHVMTDEGGAISEEYLVEYAVDRTATTGSVFLGLTLGCARCHEHKFDPISQDEFYGLYAFFNSLEEPGLYSQLPSPNRAFEPFLAVPSKEQEHELKQLEEQLAQIKIQSMEVDPAESSQQTEFLTATSEKIGWGTVESALISAASDKGATLTVSPDQTILASGENPSVDVHTITLRTEATDLNLVCLEALAHASHSEGRVGRAPNGNAVLTGVSAEAISISDPAQKTQLSFRWAWADHEQSNGDFGVINILDSDEQSGWAAAGHLQSGGRIALLLADAPFGFPGGTEIVVRLEYLSKYPQHAFGNVRLRLGRMASDFAAQMPAAQSGWYKVGPFPTPSDQSPYEISHGPELNSTIDVKAEFGNDKKTWQYDLELKDDRLNKLAAGTNVSYVARRIWAPQARTVKVALGSDDGFDLFVNGKSVKQQKVERSLAANQDSAEVPLLPGINSLVFKVINTGGDAGFFYRQETDENQWPGDLVLAVVPPDGRGSEVESRLHEAWRIRYSPKFRQQQTAIAELEKQRAALLEKTPLTMVMHELAEPRTTYVLARGAYDKPDMNRPVQRSIPASLGSWPIDQPRDRLGLAHWMTSENNPLVARVAVNRMWEQFFGTGLVQTSEDFGMQGEWPSHPELLDWLAVELRESNWDTQHIMRLIVSSSTYRQSSRVRPEVRDRDPDNRLLSYFPRRRLTAEQIRDQALYVSGLLVEKWGGPSVKPYQPEGLWQEVAMLASNTRIYEPGIGSDLWRRSVYTYWKRACPPPTLQAFDAPTRESCTIRRGSTNTPLQALVLWNDPQFVEAARVLAQRTLAESVDDADRLQQMFCRCTGRQLEGGELRRLQTSLAKFREQNATEDAAAQQLLKIGAAAVTTDIPPTELAAWTMVASAILNLTETIVID